MTQRPLLSGGVLVVAAAIGFNGGCWQLYRMVWKANQMKFAENASKNDTLTFLPCNTKGDAAGAPLTRLPIGMQFTRVKLRGIVDNEGAVLVGPRPPPFVKGRQEGQKTGFVLLTPMQLFDPNTSKLTKETVMVNRGWVPIEAHKSRVQRAMFTGEGYQEMTVNGVLKLEEAAVNWRGALKSENYAPQMQDVWMVNRPFEILKGYYRVRFGGAANTNPSSPLANGAQADRVEVETAARGLRNYFVEMIEDHSGSDQILLRGSAFPMRRTLDDYNAGVTITPNIHLMYATFWFFVCGGSLYGMSFLRRALQRKAQEAAVRASTEVAEATRRQRQAEAAAAAAIAFQRGGAAVPDHEKSGPADPPREA